MRQVQIIFENVPGKPIFPQQIVSNLSNQNLILKHDLILNNHWPMWHLKINVPISYLCIMFCSSNWILNWKKYSALLYLRIFRKGWIRNQIFFNKNLIIGFEFFSYKTISSYHTLGKMLCAIWFHLHNLKNVKNTNGRVVLSVKLQIVVAVLHGCFSRFLNCT